MNVTLNQSVATCAWSRSLMRKLARAEIVNEEYGKWRTESKMASLRSGLTRRLQRRRQNSRIDFDRKG